MSLLTSPFGAFVDLVLWPFRGLPSIAGLTVFALLTAAGLLLVYKRTSNQARLSEVKRRLHASLFEIRLFNDDFLAILRAQRDLLRHNLTYVRLSLVPLLWTIVPLTLVVAQLQFRFGYVGLEPGRTALVKVQMNGAGADASVRPELALTAPDGLLVETPPVWIPSLAEAAWRIRAVREGRYDVAVRVNGTTLTKTVVVSRAAMDVRSPVRHAGSLLDTLLYPIEPPLPAGEPVAAITITYPEQAVPLGVIDLHWMIVFFVLSMLFAFALRKPFGVVF